MTCLRAVASAALLGLLLTGCGQQSHINEMSKKTWIPKTATWPELQALWHTEDYKDYTLEKLERGHGAGAKEGLNSPGFQQRLKTFESTPIPAEHATPEREAAKVKFVAAIRKATESLRNGISDEFHSHCREIGKLNSEIVQVPGQAPPAGSAAEQFAPAYVPTEADKARVKKQQRM